MTPSTQQLFIISPAPGEVLQGNAVKIAVKLPPGITLVDPATHTVLTPGEGHLHFWLDSLPKHDDATSVTVFGSPEYTYTNTFSGLHTLRVELFQNDHTSYAPPMIASVDFETVAQSIPQSTAQSRTIEVRVPNKWLLIPHSRSNMIFASVIAVLALAILWFVVERKKKKEKK